MFIDKINSMLEPYWETERNYTLASQLPPDDSNYNTAMDLASSLGLEEHPDLLVWGAYNGETGDVLAMGLTKSEALSLTEYRGDPIRTAGEREGTDFLYYDA